MAREFSKHQAYIVNRKVNDGMMVSETVKSNTCISKQEGRIEMTGKFLKPLAWHKDNTWKI